jgi:hypothetical protein
MRIMSAIRPMGIVGLILAFASSLAAGTIVNGGFEAGNTNPWTFVNGSAGFYNGAAWTATGAAAHSGDYGARADGNWMIRQNFAGVPVTDIASLSFWLRRPFANLGDASQLWVLMTLYYSDNSFNWYFTPITSNNWAQFDVTSSLNTAKTLTGIDTGGFLSCGGKTSVQCAALGPFVTDVDDFSLVRKSDPVVPEPGSFGLLVLGALLFAAHRRFA